MQLGHEQAQQIFAQYGIAVVPFIQIKNVEQGREAVQQLGGDTWIIRCRPNFERKVKGEQELQDTLASLFSQAGHGPVFIEGKVNTEKCIYVSFELNTRADGFTVVVYRSKQEYLTTDINPLLGILAYQCRDIADFLQLNPNQTKALIKLLTDLYRLFTEKDLILLEFDPLLLSDRGEFFISANKMIMDDRALFRQTLADTADGSSELAIKHSDLGIRFYPSHGDIGCIVNGRGMVLATQDMIKAKGGKVASILDIGTNVAESKFIEAIHLILNQEDIKVVFINIFGGFVRCDVLAEDITQALAESEAQASIVIRLEGTHAEQGRVLLKQTEYPIIGAEDFSHGVELAVKMAQ